jgi:hypothetical protein
MKRDLVSVLTVAVVMAAMVAGSAGAASAGAVCWSTSDELMHCEDN